MCYAPRAVTSNVSVGVGVRMRGNDCGGVRANSSDSVKMAEVWNNTDCTTLDSRECVRRVVVRR